jgi:hypothetical protein
MRAPDWWESARFQEVCVAWSRFRQNGVVSSHPPAGNASRWAVVNKSKLIHLIHGQICIFVVMF